MSARKTCEIFTSYSWTCDKLTAAQMRTLVDDVRPTRKKTDWSVDYIYRWRDFRITASILAADNVWAHASQVVGLVHQLYDGRLPKRGRQLVRCLDQTRLAVTVYLEPERDKKDRWREFFARLFSLLQPVTFGAFSLYDSRFRLLIGPDGSSNPDAKVE